MKAVKAPSVDSSEPMLLQADEMVYDNDPDWVFEKGGLKAALERGAQVAVAQLGAPDGFLGNDKVRIGLPDVLEKAASILRTIESTLAGIEIEPVMERGSSVKRIATRTETAADLVMFERGRQRE